MPDPAGLRHCGVRILASAPPGRATTSYYLHLGPSTLPRSPRQPFTLGEAMHQAYGHRYAVVYRMYGEARVPIVADAGSDEVIFVPTGRRVHRDGVDWRMIGSDRELVLAMLKAK